MEKFLIHVALCTSGKIYSGGERCLIELVKNFEKMGYIQEVLVSHPESGCELHSEKNLSIKCALKDIGFATTKVKALYKYIVTLFGSLRYLKNYKKEVIIVSHSEMWPDVLFSFLLKIFNPKGKWFLIIHALVPNKTFDNSKTVIRLHNIIAQRLMLLLQVISNGIITVNSNYLEFLKKYNKNILIIKLGKETPYSKKMGYENRKYDLCFVGRYFPYKGIYEIPEIIEQFVQLMIKNSIKKKIEFVLMGKENELSTIMKSNLQRFSKYINVYFKGFVQGEEKHRNIASSKVTMFPSYTESFGLVYLDSISNGTPVVEYDLKCFELHRQGVVKVPFKKNDLFAKKLFEIIFDKNIFEKISQDGIRYSSQFDWKLTAKSIDQYFFKDTLK